MSDPVSPDLPLTLTLPTRVVNMVLKGLSKMPLEESLEAFIMIKNQADKQAMAATLAPPQAVDTTPPPNGKDVAH